MVSQFEYHPTHRHWHVNGVALFEIRVGSPDGPVFGGNSVKTTFCLIDWYKLDDNAKTPERGYFACAGPTKASAQAGSTSTTRRPPDSNST